MTKNNNNVKVAEAGILGAIVGAAVGAGAVALSSEKNRQVIKSKFNELKKQGEKVLNDIQDKASELTSESKKTVDTKVDKIKKSIKSKL